MALSRQEIIDAVAEMSVLDLSELITEMEDKFGVTASAAVAIPEALDIAQIRQRAGFALVYIVRTNGAIEQVILPVYGAGLWSTMFGYLAVAGDGATIRGLRFYEHAETPGLGDQIDGVPHPLGGFGRISVRRE